jgi:TRAP-type C4-dicarboxylate transport system substrate-binding protein
MRTKHSITMISLFAFLTVLCLSVVSSEAKVTIKLPHESPVGGPYDQACNLFAKRAEVNQEEVR